MFEHFLALAVTLGLATQTGQKMPKQTVVLLDSDGLLITGQNPASSVMAAEALISRIKQGD